jgi:hypothetical protein
MERRPRTRARVAERTAPALLVAAAGLLVLLAIAVVIVPR